MADLDVAVRLKFLTSGEGELKAAAKDIAAFGKSLNQLSGKATGRFAADLDKATRASQRLQATLGKSAKSANQLAGRATARFGYDLNKASTASAKLGGSLDKSARAAGKTATGLRAIGSGAAGIDRARASVDRLAKSTNALGAAGKRVKAGALGAATGSGVGGGVLAAGAIGGAVTGRRKAAFKEGLAEAASRVTPNGYLIGAGTAVAAGAVVGGTVATVGAAMAYGTKQAIDYEKAMADVKKKVTLDKGASWGDVERIVNKVSRQMGIARVETAGLVAEAGAAGIEYKDLGEFARLAAKASSAWDIAPEEASNRLAKIKAMTQWTIPQLEEFADQLNAIADNSASKERDVLEMFMRSADAARAANVPLKTTLAATTALDSIGMQPEIASRFFNMFSSSLRTAASGGGAKDAAEGFKMLGLSVAQVEQGMKSDATKTMLDVLDRMEKSPNKAAAAIKIFGKGFWDEAARSGQALPEFIKNLKIVDGDSWKGSLARNQKIVADTTVNRLERVKALTSEIGDNFMRWGLTPIGDVSDKWLAAAERWERAADAERILSKAGKGMLSAADEKRLASDPDLRAKFEARLRALKGTGESLADYQKRLDLGRLDPTIADRDGVNKALPHAEKMSDVTAFDPDKIWRPSDKKSKKQKRAVRAAPIPTFANEVARRPATAILEPTYVPPKHVPLPPRRPQQVTPTDRAPVVGGSVPAFASGTGVTTHVDAAPIERLKSIAEGAKRVLEGLDVKVSPNVDTASVVFAKGQSEEAKKAFEGLNLSVSPIVNSGSLDAALAKANALNGVLRAIGTGGAPGATRRVNPTLTGAPRGGGSSSGGGSTGGGGSAPATPGRQARHGHSPSVNINTAHFHGVRDPRAMHRQLAALDRRIINARDNALHDIG
jgi:TP901 family phage tail tape measure protein